MKYINSSADLGAHCQITEIELVQLYLEATDKNPKPQDISQSLYLTMLAIAVLERMGNRMPTQAEIDCIELHLKRYSKKKTMVNRDGFYTRQSTLGKSRYRNVA